MELTAQEKLIQFIHSLTDEECRTIVAFLTQEDSTIGDADCTAPKGGRYLIAISQMNETEIATGACL